MSLRFVFALLLLLPGAHAGTQAEPELRDDAGDVAYSYAPMVSAIEPWQDAVDLLGFWVTVDEANAYFHYQFKDFSNLSTGNLYAYSGRGSALYAHTFLDVDNQTLDDTVFFEYRATATTPPAWNFRYGQTPLNGSVDEATATVSVVVPLSALGAAPGSQLKGFHLWAASTPTFPVYAIDYLPDSEEPCTCAVTIPAPTVEASSPPTETPGGREAPDWGLVGLLLGVGLALTVRRRSS